MGKFGSAALGEDIPAYIARTQSGAFSQKLYQQLVGSAGPYKEGDETIGVAAANPESRENARKLLENTRIEFFQEHPLHEEALQKLIWQNVDPKPYTKTRGWSIGELKSFLLSKHNTFSAYLTTAAVRDWGTPRKIDHHGTQLVSGIADTALKPEEAAAQSVNYILPSGKN